MSTPTRPVWALPAIGAGAGTLFGLLGGINVDDPNVVPSVKAKKLLRTLVLGAAAGLGAEAVLRGGGIVYKNLMSKSSAANPARRFRHKTLYNLLKQADTIPAIGSPSTDNPFPIVENVNKVESIPEPDPTPTTPNNTPPSPNTQKEPKTESWLNQSPMGIPNGYLALGLGGLFGGGLLYHLLTEKKKRKPSGYLNAGGAGLLAGLLGYGAYHLSQGGLGGITKKKEDPDKKPTGPLVDYTISDNNDDDWRNQVNPYQVGVDNANIKRDVEEARKTLVNQNRLSNSYDNRGLTLKNPNWYTESDNTTNATINNALSNAFNKDPYFSRAITAAVMGPSSAEALFDISTSQEFSKDPIAYNNQTKNSAREDLRGFVYDLILNSTGAPPEATTLDNTVNNIVNYYSQSAESIPFRAKTLADDVTSFANWHYNLRFHPNNPTIARDPAARQFSYDSAIPHLVQRMGGRRLTNDEFRQLNQLTKQLEADIWKEREWIAKEYYKVPESASLNFWSLMQGALSPSNSQGKFSEGIRAVADKETSEFHQAVQRDQLNIKNFFTKVLSTPGELLLPPPPTATPTYAPGSPVPASTGTKLNIGAPGFAVPEGTPESTTAETPRPTHNAPPILLHPGSMLKRPAEGSYWASQYVPDILYNAGYDVRGAKVAWNPDGTGNVVFADGTPNLKLNADGSFKPKETTPTNNTPHLGTLTSPVQEGAPTEDIDYTNTRDPRVLAKIEENRMIALPNGNVVITDKEGNTHQYMQQGDSWVYVPYINSSTTMHSVPAEQNSNSDNSSSVLPGQPQQLQPLPGDQGGTQNSASLKDSPGPYIDPVTGTVAVGTGLGVGAAGLGIASVSPMSPESALANPNQGGITRLKTRGQIPERAELQRYVDLIQGRITPEEFMSPGRTNELDDIIVKVTDANASSISNGQVNRVINNEKVRGVAQQRITEIDGEIQSIFNNIDKTNPAAVSEANTKIDNLRAQKAKWEKISLAGSQIQPTAEDVANYNAQRAQLENDIKALQQEELQLRRTPKQITGELKNTQNQLAALDRKWKKQIKGRMPSATEQAAYTARRDALQQQINSLTKELSIPRRTPVEIQTDISNVRGQLQALNESWTKPKFHPGYSEEFLLDDLREAMNIRDSISPQNQKLTAELEARLRQIDRFPALSARGEIKQALKREAVLGYLRDVHEAQVAANIEAKSNPIFSQWKNDATKAVDNIRLASGERLPWEYRVSPAEIDKIINDPLAETILKKPAIPGVKFSDAVKYANDPELIRAATNLETAQDAVAKSMAPELKLQAQKNLQRAQEAFNQALSKHTYGSVFGNSIPEELANIPYEIGKAPNDILEDIAKVKTPPRDLSLSRLEHPFLDPQALPKNYREGAYLISGDLNKYTVDLNTKKHIVNQARARFGAGHPVTIEAEKAYAATAKEALRDTLRNLHIDQYIRGVASQGNPSLIYLQQLQKDPRIAKDPLLRGIVDDAFAAVKSDIAHIHPNNILQGSRELEPVDPEFKSRLAEESQQRALNEERRIIERNASELERARQTKIQGLVERAEAYRNAGDISGAEKIEAVLKKEFGVDMSVYNAVQEQNFIDDILTRPKPTLPKELGTKLQAIREAEAVGDTATVSKLKEELNQLINGKKPTFWERMGLSFEWPGLTKPKWPGLTKPEWPGLTKPEWPGLTGPEWPHQGSFTPIEGKPFDFNEWLNNLISKPIAESTGLPEVPPSEAPLSPRAKQIHDFIQSQKERVKELREAGQFKEADELENLIRNNPEELIHPSPKPAPTPTKVITDETLTHIEKEINKAWNGSKTFGKQKEKTVANAIDSLLQGRTADESKVIIDHLAKKGLLPPGYISEGPVGPIIIKNEPIPTPNRKTPGARPGRLSLETPKVPPKAPIKPVPTKVPTNAPGATAGTKAVGDIAGPLMFIADLASQGVQASTDEAKKAATETYARLRAMGYSDEEARRESAREFRDVLIEESGKTALDRIPGTALDWTLALPQHLRNGYEWLWSLAGVEPNYWTPTDTHKADFSSVYNSKTKFDDTVGTVTHSLVDSAEALADLAYAQVHKPTDALRNLEDRLQKNREAIQRANVEAKAGKERANFNMEQELAALPVDLGNETYEGKLKGLKNYEKWLIGEIELRGKKKKPAGDLYDKLQEVSDNIAKLESGNYVKGKSKEIEKRKQQIILKRLNGEY